MFKNFWYEILERPAEVNEQLRWLIEATGTQERRVSS